MVAGLLCDLGELLLQKTFPEQYLTVLNAGTERHWKEQCARETAEFGVDHAEVGAYCLARWKLGEELTGAIRWHHQPSSAPLPVAPRARLLYFAGCIAHLSDRAR